jgi:hypothetical protein
MKGTKAIKRSLNLLPNLASITTQPVANITTRKVPVPITSTMKLLCGRVSLSLFVFGDLSDLCNSSIYFVSKLHDLSNTFVYWVFNTKPIAFFINNIWHSALYAA